MKLLRSAMIALLSGAVAGLVIGGIGGRIAMRMVADSVHRFPELTLATLNVLAVATTLGLAGSLILIVVQRLVPSSVLVQGLALTAAILAMVSGPLYLRPTNPGDELSLNPSLGRLLFSALIVAYGLTVPVLAHLLDRYVPAEERYRTRMAIASFVLGAPGLLGIGALIALVFAE